MTLPPPGLQPPACPNCVHKGEQRVTKELLAAQLRQAQEAVASLLAAQHDIALRLFADRINLIEPTSTFSKIDPRLPVAPTAELETLELEPSEPAPPTAPPKVAFEPVLPLGPDLRMFQPSRPEKPETFTPSPPPDAPRDVTEVAAVRPPGAIEDDDGSGRETPRPETPKTNQTVVRIDAPDPVMTRENSEGGTRKIGASQAKRGRTSVAGRVHAIKWELLEVWKNGLQGENGEKDFDPYRSLGRVTDRMNSGLMKTLKTMKTTVSEIEGFDDKVEEKDAYTSDGFCANFVIHPYNPCRSVWDVGSLFLVLWDMFFIPMGFFDPPETPFLQVMTWTTRCFWTLDMPLSFFAGFVTTTGCIELRPKQIVKKYLKTWFLLDSLVVGVDWFELLMAAAAEGLGFARFGKASRVFRILRMIRLLRLARMTEVISLLTERLDSEKLVILIDVVKLVVIMVGAGHMLACLWYAIGNADNSTKNWLHEFNYVGETLEFRYVMSLRWAMSQFAGGMDEVTPQSLLEHIYAVIVYLSAFWSGAVFVSILTSSMTQWYIIGSQNAQQLTILRRYLSQNGISKKLALRVQRNAKHSLDEEQRHMPEDAVALIKHVSEPLRVELHFEMYSPMLQIHPFWERYIEECPHVVRKVSHSAMQANQVSPGDTIFNVGEIPARPKMFIVNQGHLDYFLDGSAGDGSAVTPGHWVSEGPLWVTWIHRGTLSASEDCRIYTLDAKEFQSIVGQFEHTGFDPRAYAQMFVDALNNKEDEISDLPDDEMTAQFKETLNQVIHHDHHDDSHHHDHEEHHGIASIFGITRRRSDISHAGDHHTHDSEKNTSVVPA